MAASKSHAAATSLQQANKLVNNDGLIKKIKALFFDLDNTLIATRAGDSKAIRKLAELLENQYAFNKDESIHSTQTFLKAFRRCPDNSQTSLESWRTYLWRDALPQRHKHLAEKIYSKWLQLRYRYLAFSAEHVQMLRGFREAGMLLALITNGPSNAQWEKIKKTNARQYFDCILVSSDLPWEKPNPNIFFAACNFLGVKPFECAMIGDKLETDIKGGRLANLGATLWLPLSPNDADDLTDVPHRPDIILRQLIDVCKYFPLHNHSMTTANGAGSGEAIINGLRRNCASIMPTVPSSSASAGINSGSGSGGTCNSGCSNSNGGVLLAQSRRRGSQINSSSTAATSTCESDMLQRQTIQHLRNNIYFNNRHIHPHHHHHTLQQQQKYRRGNSLSAMECVNSEAENSSDSIFN